MFLAPAVGLFLLSSPDVKFERASKAAPLIVVPVKINGKGPFRFVLDTGASASTLTPKTASALALKSLPHKATAVGAGGSQEVELVKVEAMELGGQKANDLTLAVDALADVAAVAGDLDGVLGDDFLRRFVLEIDYPSSVLRLRSPQSR